MVTPDEEHDHYVKDPRIPCKYGVKCYQKNSSHHQKYKHPPKQQSEERPLKRFKLSQEQPKKILIISNDVSESGESSNDGEVAQSSSSGVTNQHPSKEDQTREDEVTLPVPKPFDKKAFINEKFLVDMPEDFYLFWDFCKSLNAADPCKALEGVGLLLVGPFDVLADKFTNKPEKLPEDYLVHWRFYYDPPELQTVIKGSSSTGYHIGYFRDDPFKLPVFLGSNSSKKNGEISCMGDNIFAAINLYLEESKISCDPFKKISITKTQSLIKSKAEQLSLDLSKTSPSIKERSKKVLVRTFNKAGLIVPYDRKTQLGYRHLCVSEKELRKVLDQVAAAPEQKRPEIMSELQPILTATSIATDECDFGTGIELAWDILAHGVNCLNSTIEQFLTTAYGLLHRDGFAKIARAHMRNRRNETELSIL